MTRNLIGIAVSFAFVFSVMLLSRPLSRRDGELGRKAVHILVSNWWIIAMAFFDSPWWAAVVPACFVVLNYLSYRYSIFKAMERGGGKEDLGTVYYAISLMVLSLISFSRPGGTFAGAAGILAMGYGDGMAALVGQRVKSPRFRVGGSIKSVAGSGAMLVASFAAVLAVAISGGVPSPVLVALAVAGVATLAEAITPWGLDNLTVPFSAAGTYAALTSGLLPPQLVIPPVFIHFCFVLAAAMVSWVALKKRWLDELASVTAFAVACALYFLSGGAMFAMLIGFFLSSSTIGKFRARERGSVESDVHAKHGTRDAVQVLCNSLAALVMAVLYALTRESAFVLAGYAAFAACNADTWASEIGVLSRGNPVSILTFKPVKRGMSGGVTALGMVASALGAAFIGLIDLCFQAGKMDAPSLIARFALITLVGAAGSVIDSLLGASLQAKYLSHETGEWTEKPYEANRPNALAKGLRWMTNDAVNLFSSAAAALVMALIARSA